MIYKRALSPDDLTRRGLDSSILHRKAFQRGLLTGETANPIMRALASQLLNSAELEQALKVTQLSDNQHFSWLPGMVNKFGRASCRDRVFTYVYISVVAASLKKKIQRIEK